MRAEPEPQLIEPRTNKTVNIGTFRTVFPSKICRRIHHPSKPKNTPLPTPLLLLCSPSHRLHRTLAGLGSPRPMAWRRMLPMMMTTPPTLTTLPNLPARPSAPTFRKIHARDTVVGYHSFDIPKTITFFSGCEFLPALLAVVDWRDACGSSTCMRREPGGYYGGGEGDGRWVVSRTVNQEAWSLRVGFRRWKNGFVLGRIPSTGFHCAG